MAEPTIIIEICKLIASKILAIKNAFLSIQFMLFCLIVGAISAFVPLSCWEYIKMPGIGEFCQTHHEIAMLICILATIIMALLFACYILRAHREKSEFKVLINNLTPVELKAMCNAYHNGGKYSVPSCYAELESLKKKGLIDVSPESSTFGGQEFTLSCKAYMYIEAHKNFFKKQGVEPDPPDGDELPFAGVI